MMWVDAWASIPTVARSIPCHNEEAVARLRRALADGKIRAQTREGRAIAREEWNGDELNLRDEIEIWRDDLFRWLGQSAPSPSTGGAKRGPKPSWDWDAFWPADVRIVHDEGLPATQAEMIERMKQWFVDNYDDHPSTSEIRKRVAPIFREIDR